MKLDDLSESIHTGNYQGVFREEGDDDDDNFEVGGAPRMLDDSEQEGSDIEYSDSDQGNENNETSGPEEEEEDENEEEDEDDEEGEEEEEQNDNRFPAHVYHPTPGEDIYGRPLNTTGVSEGGGKYIPPALRKLPTSSTKISSAMIDEVAVLSLTPHFFRLLKHTEC